MEVRLSRHVIIPSIIAGIVTWIFMYLDAKLFDQPKTTGTYVKGVLFNMVLVGIVVYFFCGKLSGPAVQHVNALAANAMIQPQAQMQMQPQVTATAQQAPF